MRNISNLEYLKLSRLNRLLYKLGSFFTGIPGAIWGLIKGIGLAVARFFAGIFAAAAASAPSPCVPTAASVL